MSNAHRGEIEAEFDGKCYCLCLTLGALAELEHAFGEDEGKMRTTPIHVWFICACLW